MEGGAPLEIPEVPACLHADHLAVELEQLDGSRTVAAISRRMTSPATCLSLSGLFTIDEIEALLTMARQA
jgi:hypothetical protein